MSEKSVLIIGADSSSRRQIEQLLGAKGWRCLVAGSMDEVQSFHGWESGDAVLISSELLLSGALTEFVGKLRPFTQVVAYVEHDDPALEQIADSQQVFGFIRIDGTQAWHVVQLVQRAVDYARALRATQTADIEHVYRSLFEASAILHSAESLPDLLERTCREIAAGAGFGRAILILGDAKFRVRNAQAYWVEEHQRVDLNHLLGQPLMPALPDDPLVQVGRGYSQQQTEPRITSRHLVIPLERSDGTVMGLLTLDQPRSEAASFASISEPVSLLLKIAASFIDTQELKAEIRRRHATSDSLVSDRSADLRQAQERFSRLVNLTDDIVYLTDAQGRIVYLNESFTSRLGYARENYIGQPIEAVLSDLAAENEATSSAVALIGDKLPERTRCEIDLFSKTGYRRVFSLAHQWVRQGDEIVAGQGLLKDMTEQRELQTRLARSERLGLAGKLASGVAHEINNPLQAISSHLAGITDKVGKDSKALESLGIVSDSVERIRLLMRSMMDLQRAEASVRAKEDLNVIIGHAVALLSPQLRGAAVEVVTDLDQASLPGKVNAGEIEQVLINLILNAIEAMPLGGTLRLTSARRENTIEVRVTDNGRGISQQIMPSLFKAFSTHRQSGEGLGLGLYMSRNIMRQHGGDLRAESPPGQGATFFMTLPLAE